MYRIIDRYTDQEFEELQEILPHYEGPGYVGFYRAKAWLDSYDNHLQRNQVLRLLNQPLEQMPLYINSNSYSEKYLSMWRLKIGR